jgi:hypothetical protein
MVKNEKINEIERTWVRSPPRATSILKNNLKEKITEPKFWDDFNFLMRILMPKVQV